MKINDKLIHFQHVKIIEARRTEQVTIQEEARSSEYCMCTIINSIAYPSAFKSCSARVQSLNQTAWLDVKSLYKVKTAQDIFHIIGYYFRFGKDL